MSNLAPIVLFVYNRPRHTKQVLEALSANALAKQSDLIIYCDGAKIDSTQTRKERINEVRSIIDNLHDTNPTNKQFQSITIIKRPHNLGLADSIINGITEVIKQYGKAIILEDDIVVSPVFLDYMNASLEYYAKEPKVWSINAWNYPIDSSDLGDTFFSRLTLCWGWATWRDRWQLYKRDIDWILQNFNKNDISHINLDDYAKGYYGDFILNLKGTIKSWAIFNYLMCYKHSGLNLTPKIPYIKQIGFDGSGVHCGNEDFYNSPTINTTFPITFPRYIEENRIALTRIQNFHTNLKRPIAIRVKNKAIKIAKKIVKWGGVASNYQLPYTLKSHSNSTQTSFIKTHSKYIQAYPALALLCKPKGKVA